MRHRILEVVTTAIGIAVVAALAGCEVQPSGRYQSDPNHYPYYRAVEETPSTPEEGWLKGMANRGYWSCQTKAWAHHLTPYTALCTANG